MQYGFGSRCNTAGCSTDFSSSFTEKPSYETIREDVVQELRAQLQQEVRTQLQQEVRDQLQQEVRDQMQQEVREQMQQEVRDQMQEVRDQMRREFQQHLREMVQSPMGSLLSSRFLDDSSASAFIPPTTGNDHAANGDDSTESPSDV